MVGRKCLCIITSTDLLPGEDVEVVAAKVAVGCRLDEAVAAALQVQVAGHHACSSSIVSVIHIASHDVPAMPVPVHCALKQRTMALDAALCAPGVMHGVPYSLCHTWPEVELVQDLLQDLLVGDLASLVGVHVHRQRLRDADGI